VTSFPIRPQLESGGDQAPGDRDSCAAREATEHFERETGGRLDPMMWWC